MYCGKTGANRPAAKSVAKAQDGHTILQGA
jgi:hypothetical protein